MKYYTLKWCADHLSLIDQRYLPTKIAYFKAYNYQDVIYAIKEMVIRGAPAIGAAAAFGYYLAYKEAISKNENSNSTFLSLAVNELKKARPTAVNLSWALEKMDNLAQTFSAPFSKQALNELLQAAENIIIADQKVNKKIGAFGQEIVPPKGSILTHCNAGSLATCGYGTALGVIRSAFYAHKKITVFCDETRPRLQGAKITAFELSQEGIPHYLITEGTAAFMIAQGKIDLCIVGADRIAKNGDTANKIGTFMLATICKLANVPFFVAAPLSTIDLNTADGTKIPIEERSSTELTQLDGLQIAPLLTKAYNPAFDVTEAEKISGIITEVGILRPPFTQSIAQAFHKKQCNSE